MKAYTSRDRFDETRRFTFVGEEMGRVRLDSDANEQARLVRTDARRRSRDVADGSPDDGFLVGAAQLLDPIATTAGWSIEEFVATEERRIRPELTLDRREPESLPHVVHVRGAVSATRTLPRPLDLLHLPLFAGGTTTADALMFQVRFRRPPTDDELVDVGPFVIAADGVRHRLGALDAASFTGDWQTVRVPIADLAALPRTALPDGSQALPITGWGFLGLPPRADIYFDALLAETADIAETDLVIRGGDGTLGGAGRIFVDGFRTFIEQDWRYLTQPDLPSPPPLARPADLTERTLVEIDVWERPIHGFQDSFIAEPALDGDDSTFRGRKVTQIRARPLAAGLPPLPRTPTGDGRLTTNIPSGSLPDRFPPEAVDPCRDRCLFSENASTGEGYRGRDNVHVRVEILATDGPRPIVGWSRNNAATVAPLTADAPDAALSVLVGRDDARRFVAGDLVVVEDERSRLDPDRDIHRARLRRLRSVDTATGRLEFEPAGAVVTTDPDPLPAGGPLGRTFSRGEHAAVRLWDGADWLLTGIRYNLADGITFALTGADFRTHEYWTFVARVTNPDGGALGVVEQLTESPVHGPWHARAPIAFVHWTATSRTFEDLRKRFMPLQDVRDRLIELGRRHLSPGAFTVVVGDGTRTFGDIDQDLGEGVTGDEAIQAALDRLGPAGGSIYIRAGQYELEHTVLIASRSNISILGDRGATRLRVSGAGGAFYLDFCGHQGAVSLEELDLTEAPMPEVLSGGGGGVLVPDIDLSLANNAERPGDLSAAIPLRPVDLAIPSATTAVDLIGQLADSIRILRPSQGRAGLAVLRTIARLRQLQRAAPDVPLETSAPDELAVLRALPHGVVTVSDSSRIRLARLTIASQVPGAGDGTIAAGVLIVGSGADITIADNRIAAPSGIVAAAYGRTLAAPAFILRPRAGLFLTGVEIAGNRLAATGGGSFGIRIADGELDGITVSGNSVEGFEIGIGLEDRAETRLTEAVDRMLVSGNRVLQTRRIGIRVGADGADVEGNEIRPAAAASRVRAAIQVTGTRNRLRENWITLPASATPRPALTLEAGVLIGHGGDEESGVDRPVSDIEITGNRIEGAGAATAAVGIMLVGALPIFGVRMSGNTISRLGDAGIRGLGHAAALGGLTVQGNSIEAVALAYLSWGQPVLDDVAALAPDVTIAAGATPVGVLQALVNAPSVPRAAIEGLLRWLDGATLRGGIVLSLAEESVVRDNRVRQIGAGDLPVGFVAPGAEVRTAAVMLVGGRDIVAQGNALEQVKGAVERPPAPLPPVPPRPPVFDNLRVLDLRANALQVVRPNVFAGSAALRRELLDYARGSDSDRQRIGMRIYGAIESLQSALEAHTPETRRLAAQLGEALEEMLGAQGAAPHLATANLTRAILSQAAALTAPPGAIEAWSAAASLDQAILADNAAVTAAAQSVLDNADDLLKGLDELQIRLAELATAVVRVPDSMPARLALAGALGTVAEARTRKTEFEARLPPGGTSAQDRAVFTGLVRLIQDGLATPETEPPDIASLQDSVDALAGQLDRVQEGLSQRIRAEFQSLRRTDGRPNPEQLARFRATLQRVGELAAGNVDAAAIDAGDLQAQQTRFMAELVTISARALDARLAGLGADADANSTRELRLMRSTAGQLTSLASAPSLASHARAVEAAINLALSDPERRTQHQQEARKALTDLQAEQSRLAGVAIAATAPAPQTGASSERIAALGQVVLEMQATTSDNVFNEGLSLVSVNIRRSADELGLRGEGRELVLGHLRDAADALSATPSAATRAAGLASLGSAIDRLGEYAARAPEATEEAGAVRTVVGVLRRALSTEGDEATRLRSVRDFVAANPETLAASRSEGIVAASSIAGIVSSVGDMLGVITRVPRLPPLVPGRPPVRPHPADGAFAAGVDERLLIAGNTIEDVRVGIAIGSPAAHPLIPPDARSPGVAVNGNRIFAAAVAGIDVDLASDGKVAIEGNELAECGGAPTADGGDFGQFILRARGRGDLSVAGNRMHDNGNGGGASPLHEILIDWDGDVRVRDNRLRHAGSQAGGSGIVAVYGAIEPALVRSLAQSGPLQAEPPPATAPPPSAGGTGRASLLDDLLATGLTSATALGAGRSAFDAGALKLAVAPSPLRYSVMQTAARPVPTVTLAETRARAWLDRPVAAALPLLDFIRRPPLRIALPPLAALRWSIQVAGNDIVANGPALLVLAGAGPVLSATVVANELESLAPTAAAYLRDVDTTVFAENRCEALRFTNVVVLRCRASLVSIVGNAVAGAEPVSPPSRPLPLPKPRPTRPDIVAGTVFLTADLGTGSAVSVPLDSRVLLDKIRATQDSSFAAAADRAAGNFNRFALRNAVALTSDVAGVLSQRAGGAITLESLAGVHRLRAAATPAERESGAAAASPGVAAAVDAGNLILGSPELDNTDKIFGVARLAGLSDAQANQFVRSQLVASEGNIAAALTKSIRDLTGIDANAPAAAGNAPPTARNLLEQMLVLAVADKDIQPLIDPVRPILPPPPPRPQQFSIVVLGGSRVAAVGNTSTAGIYVQPGVDTVLLNP